MSQEDLENAGLLLPKKLWGRTQFGSTVNIYALITAGVLGLGSCVLIYIGSGSWFTWLGIGVYFLFLGIFLFISLRAIETQNRRVEKQLEKAGEEDQRFDGEDEEEEKDSEK